MKPEKSDEEKAEVEKALSCSLMRIPRMDIHTVRELMRVGFTEIHQLSGRSPEVIFEEIQKLVPQTPRDRLFHVRMAVYYSETENPNPELLHPWAWKD